MDGAPQRSKGMERLPSKRWLDQIRVRSCESVKFPR